MVLRESKRIDVYAKDFNGRIRVNKDIAKENIKT